MPRRPSHRLLRGVAALSLAAVCALSAAGCGGESGEVDATTRTAAQSLQDAMDAASRAMDNARPTRASLDNLAAALQTSADETGDVVGVLTSHADEEAAAALLPASKAQRSFLQSAERAASSRGRSTAMASLAQARTLGRKASTAYTDATRAVDGLAGSVPESTTFNTGRLRDVIGDATKKATPKPTPKGKSDGGSGGGSASSCGAGISVNSVTSCTFARNVAIAYDESGGSSTIDVYSSVTHQTYTMNCSGTLPVVCTGGNNARVELR